MGESWIGGDLAGLQNMGQVMAPAPAALRDVVHALESGVRSLAADAGWSGGAADAFVAEWTTNSLQADGMADILGAVGTTIGGLGDILQEIEAGLFNAAYAAGKQGAVVNDDGTPGELVIWGDASDPVVVSAMKAQDGYAHDHAAALDLAQSYRMQAADTLNELATQIAPGDGLPADKAVTVASVIRGLYTAPSEANTRAATALPQQITDAQSDLSAARKTRKAAMKSYADRGLKLPKGSPAWLEHAAAVGEKSALNTSLNAAKAGQGELPLSRALNTQLLDLPGAVPYAAGLPKSLSFLKSIPVVDVAASSVVAELQSRDDMEKGWSAEEARSKDYTAAGAGVVAGTAVSVGLLAVSTPALAAAAAGGMVAVGVGSAAYQAFHENWSRDIEQHGVVGGVIVGSGNVYENTVDDLDEFRTGISNSAKGLGSAAYDAADQLGTDVNEKVYELTDDVSNSAGAVWDKVFG